MIRNLPGFTPRPTATGYLLAPLDAPHLGVLGYHARVRPLARVSELVRGRLAPEFVETARSPIQALVTDEGEDAARVTVTGTHGGHGVQRDFGFVFADDFAAVIDGTCVERAAAERFEQAATQLVRGVSLGMPARRRRFRYAAPVNRRPFVRGLETDWIAVGDVLTVFPAEVSGLEWESVIAGRNGFTIADSRTMGSGIVVTTSALSGSRPCWRAVAAIAEGGWLYLMELTSAAPRPLDPLLACLASRIRVPTRSALDTYPLHVAEVG